MTRVFILSLGLLLAAALAACDSSITGEAGANQPPETELAVRVTDLRETLGDGTLTSTVEVNWAGTDVDGFVASYEVRFYDEARLGQIGAEAEWTATTRRDTTALFPIPPGQDRAAVVFEVRAIDNEGAKDPTPAQTIYPIRNSPPTFRIIAAEAPPDTTWPAFSFSWLASDPDSDADLAGIEIALNDTLNFTRLPADVTFATFIAEDPRATGSTAAQVFLGRGFQATELSVPGLRLDAENVVYLRSVDRTDTTSVRLRYPAEETESFFVKRVTSDILLVNDYRSSTNAVILPVHRAILDAYGAAYDEWYLAEPFQTGSTIVTAYSENFPANAEPTLRETLRFWSHIYWVSTNATNRSLGNNLPLAANVIDPFLDDGGRMFVNVATRLPSSPEDNLGNGALALLPIGGLVDFANFPDFNPQFGLSINSGAAITPQNPLPGGVDLPPLQAARFIGGTFGYPVDAGAIPLYTAEYTAQQTSGSVVPWPGPSTVASIRSDGRVALFALPLLTEISLSPYLEGADGDPDAPQQAIHLMLEALGFPR